MGISRFLMNEDIIAIDIGSSNIKMVYADIASRKVRTMDALTCATPRDSVKEGNIVDIDRVSDTIRTTIQAAGIKCVNAATAIAGPSVVVRNVLMPKMSAQMLRKSLSFEASKYISAPIEGSVIEFDILGDAPNGQMKVVLVAAPREMVDSYARVLEQSGLDPISIDIEAFASFRSTIEFNSDYSLDKGTIALLDMGASHTEINLIVSGEVMLTRNIPIAGNAITGAIKSVENCTEDEAERMKYAMDLSVLLDPSSAPYIKSSTKAVQQLLDELLREIRRSFNYYQSQLPEDSRDLVINKIILTGGAARLSGLMQYMQNRLSVDATLGDPLSWLNDRNSIKINSLQQEDYPLFSVALGLIAKEAHVSS